MTHPLLSATLADPSSARDLGDGLWSVLPAGAPSPPYDGRARLYDWLIGKRFYNRVAWGASPAAYAGFARSAAADARGPLLDAGCGTLVSTAAAHAASGRPTVLLDLSADMLRAARRRLAAQPGAEAAGRVSALQGDLNALPFADGAFETVMCPGTLHLFEDVAAITSELARVAAPGGRVFVSSLVAERPVGARYLAALHRAGEVARPRTLAELLGRLRAPGSGLGDIEARLEGCMAFIVAPPARRT